MNINRFKLVLSFLSLFFSVSLLCAQPGGRPDGPPPGGFPGGEGGPRRERNMEKAQQQSQSVRQKKIKTSGTTYKIVGTLVDSVKNEALSYVNVTVLNKEDSSFVRGAASDLNGYFQITEVPAGEYYVRVTSIGYQTIYLPVKVENNTALGTIKMQAGTQHLQAVTIKAARPLYAMDGEKMVYNVADDPSIQSGTTSDALQNAPGVEVDIEGNITLRGVSSVEIWVNDKPSKLTEENLKTYLETLPANALDRIETITNPSAKYATDAEAVINIITSAHIKKNHFISFGVNAASQPNIGPWLSYTWANERLSINLFAGMRYSRRYGNSGGWSETYQDNPLYPGNLDSLQLVMRESDTSLYSSSSLGGNLGLHIDYELDSMSDIGVWGNFNYNVDPSWDSNFHSRNTYLPSASLYEYSTEREVASKRVFGMFGGNYTKKFDKNGHNLRLFFFGSANNSGSTTQYSRIFSQTDNSIYNQNTFKYYDNNSGGTDLSLRARYNRPYSEDGDMSYGLSIGSENDSRDYRPYLLDTTYDDGTTILSDALFDTLRRYQFENHEQSVDGDVEWTHRFGNFTLQLGMGAKYEHTRFAYSETPQAFSDDTAYNFITYNPSIHMSYRTESMHNFKLNYTLRMRNPSSSNLTTYRSYTEDSYSTGNRDLTQSYTHNAEAGWSKFFNWGNISVEGYGRLSTGEIDNLTDVTDAADPFIGRIIRYTTPYNIGSSWRYGASFNATYRPSGFFNLRLYANLYDYGYSMNYDKLGAEPYSDSKWSYSIRLNGWAKIFNRYQIHASANYTSPRLGLMSVSSARYFVNMGVRSDFFNRKLSVFVNVQDIFNWGKTIGNASENTNPYYVSQSISRTLNSRYISAGITLRFGKMELEKSSQSGSEADGESSSTTTLTTTE